MATFNPLWLPDMGAQVSKKPRIKKASFGDGYEQRVNDGINTKPEEWSLTFTRTNEFVLAVDGFLDSMGGYISFWWTTPKNKTIAVVCEEWTDTVNSVDWQALSCTFRQVWEKPEV